MVTRAPMTYANRVVPATSLTKAVNISATLLAALTKKNLNDETETVGMSSGLRRLLLFQVYRR